MPSKKTTTTTKKMSATVQVAIITTIGTVIVALITGFITLAQKNDNPIVSASSTPNPTATPIPTITTSPTQAPIYSLKSGTLDIPPSSSLRSFFGSGIIKKNFMAKVIFYVPYSANKGVWDVGFTFGDGVRVVVVSSG
ncbi:MAG TPA: hypothetical protein PLT08_18275 [Anaerolineales bacterium]|nr:hypothetical protein [Anaerolineales bacterium]